MFDWASRDGVIGSPWGFFEEEGDRIVPYTAAGEIAGGFGSDRAFGEKGTPGSCIDVRGGGLDANSCQDVLLSSAFAPTVTEAGSGLRGGRGFSRRFEMDPTWSSCNVYASGDTSAASVERAVGDLGACTVLDSGKPTGADNSFSLSMDGKVELDNNSGVSVNGYEQRGDFFIDCDWASLANFDDPDGIFSDSMFWDGEMSKMGGILPQTDSLNATSQPVPRTEKVTSDGTGENLSCFFQKGESFGKRKHVGEDKVVFSSVAAGEQSSSFSHFSSRNDWSADLEFDKVGRMNKSLKSRRTEENVPKTQSMQMASMDNNSQIRQTDCPASVSQLFPSGIHHQDRLAGMSCNLFSQRGLADNPHFMVSGSSPVPYSAAGNVDQLFSACTGDLPVPSKHSFLVNSVRVAPGAVHLNPQEKIEKLKRRQQMQAMLAIEMQQKHLNENIYLTQGSNGINVLSGQRMIPELVKPTPVEQVNLNSISSSENELPATVTIFSQLGNIISKLDDNLKICMRDSLFRLARSASERMDAEDRSSVVTCSDYEDRVTPDVMGASRTRQFKLPDAETEHETNRVDRIVALLLFNKQQQIFSNLDSGPSRYKTMDLAQM